MKSIPPFRRWFAGALSFWGCGISALFSAPAPAVAEPSIVVILIDDAGFSDPSAFGGAARTPGFDRLAAEGLRYNNFHVAAICTATRAALLTGLNPHHAGFGTLTDRAGKGPGYDCRWKSNVPSIAAVLHRNGYATAAIGKWHNTPWEEMSPSGPFDRWPTRLGFDYFYGFMQPGATSLWEPHSLYRNTTPVEPTSTTGRRYHLTTDLTNEAIAWVKAQRRTAPARPFFLYFASAAVHFPIHVPAEWIERYRGRFDQGWDRYREEVFQRQKKLGVIPADAGLTPRPSGLPAWDSLTSEQKKINASEMEAYAGFVSHTDHEVNRLIEAVRAGPGGENTLIFYIFGDNGGSPGPPLAGTPAATLRRLDELGEAQLLTGIPTGWAWAVGAPFQWYKSFASHFGALRNPLVVSWPARIKDVGGLRSQFTNVSDVAATIYAAAGVEFPATHNGEKTIPLDGLSFDATFTQADAPSRRKTQYFEMWGNRSIYHDGWVAAARHRGGKPFKADPWELYHVAADFSQARDLAAMHPEKLADLRALFDAEAAANNVLPLRALDMHTHLTGTGYASTPGTEIVRFPAGSPRLLGIAAPNFLRTHRITADVTITDQLTSGILVSWGCRWSGFVLYAQEGRLFYESHEYGGGRTIITSQELLPKGRCTVGFEFVEQERSPGSPGIRSAGRGTLLVDGRGVGSGSVALSLNSAFWGAFGVGRGFGSPVSDAYALPFAFSGTLHEVTIRLP